VSSWHNLIIDFSKQTQYSKKVKQLKIKKDLKKVPDGVINNNHDYKPEMPDQTKPMVRRLYNWLVIV